MNRKKFSDYAGNFLVKYSSYVLAGILLASVIFLIPFLYIEPEIQASLDPEHEVYDVRDQVNKIFDTPLHQPVFIIESNSGDALIKSVLLELSDNVKKLSNVDTQGQLSPTDLEIQSYLVSDTVIEPNLSVLVDTYLQSDPRFGTNLVNATDDQVKMAISNILDDPQNKLLFSAFSSTLYKKTKIIDGQEFDWWISPTLMVGVPADNAKLGGGAYSVNIGGNERDLNKERFNRSVRSLLSGEQTHYKLNGLAIDVNLEAADEGQDSGMYIMFTVLIALLLVGLALRSYWALLFTGIGIALLMIWLKGVLGFLGIKGGLLVELIVPISMISLGVDFAIHAIRRYQEQNIISLGPSKAMKLGFTGVFAALLLAMFTDSIAFLSNSSSGIEGVVEFSFAATIATISSFIVLGLGVPLSLMKINQFSISRQFLNTRMSQIITLSNSLLVSICLAASIVIMIALDRLLGVGILMCSVILFAGIPICFLFFKSSRVLRNSKEPIISNNSLTIYSNIIFNEVEKFVERFVVLAQGYAYILLSIVLLITVICGYLGLKLKPDFDITDVYDPNSDVVRGVDLFEDHYSGRLGEPGTIYIRGKLDDPNVLSKIDNFIDVMNTNEYLARNPEGNTIGNNHHIQFIEYALLSPKMRGEIQTKYGVILPKAESSINLLTEEQIKAINDLLLESGVWLNGKQIIDSNSVKSVFVKDSEDQYNMILNFGVRDTRSSEVTKKARDSISLDIEQLKNVEGITYVGLTGSPFAREIQLTAITKTLQTSLPIAVVGVFILLLLVMRSFRYAIVTIIPIGIVIVWLYGFMYIFGFHLNIVTATIAAISIGIGIDYSVHMTERFRQELDSTGDKILALRHSARGTGVSLMVSALSTVAGFAVMGFAPMPLFASFGILTAVMIILAFFASVFVLPPLLIIVSQVKKSV